MSKVYEHYLEQENYHNESAPKPAKKDRKKTERQVEGQLEFMIVDGNLEVAPFENGDLNLKTSKPRSIRKQREFDKYAKRYYEAYLYMIDCIGAYIMILRPFDDLTKNKDHASDGTKKLFLNVYNNKFEYMKNSLLVKKDQMIAATKRYSDLAKNFGIDYPKEMPEEALVDREYRQSCREKIRRAVKKVDQEIAMIDAFSWDYDPKKAIKTVLSPENMRAKYTAYRRRKK